MERNSENLDTFINWFIREKKPFVFFMSIYIISLILIILSNLPPSKSDFQLESNAKKTLISDENIRYLNEIELKDEINKFENEIPIYYRYINSHKETFISNLQKFFTLLEQTSDINSILKNKDYNFSKQTLSYILENKNLKKYENKIIYIYDYITSRYIIVDKLIPEKTSLELIKTSARESITPEKTILFPPEDSIIQSLIKRVLPSLNPKEYAFYTEIIANFLHPTAFLDEEVRKNRLAEMLKTISPTENYISYKEIIIKRGEKVTQDKFIKISAYINFKIKNFLSKIFIYFLLSLSLFVLLLYRFYKFEKIYFNKLRNILISSFGFIIANIFFFLSSFFYRKYSYIELFIFIPFGTLVALLPILLIKQKTAFILLISYTFFSLFYPFFDIFSFFNILLLSLFAIYSSKLLTKRGDFFTFGVIISSFEIIYVSLYLIYKNELNTLKTVSNIIFAFGNGMISSIFSLGILPFIEDLFIIPTHFKLLELSNISTSKLLRDFRNNAPGTYNHSIMLGDMCEKAAEAIGEDPLLVKVGAYYHDIGKMQNPEYFIENQLDKNKHNEMKISMSVTIIKSHVKLGVEIAKEHRIPEEIIDFIREHHGTSTISYFYHQAINLYGDENINILDYQYPGPKPKTKGTAILMLADSIEATLRAYSQNSEKVTLNIIEDIVNDIIKKRIEQNQLEDCNITLKEINLIKDEFVKFLSNYYHKRIDYNIT